MRRGIIAVLALVWALPRVASAEGAPPATLEAEKQLAAPAGRVTMSALAGFGFGDGVRTGDDGYLGIGYGVRAGYTFSSTPVYLGGTLLRYEGPQGGSSHVDTVTLDFEVGVDIAAGPIVARPYLGLGALLSVFSPTEEAEKTADGGSGIMPRVAPGLLLWCPLGLVTLGVEARYELTPTWNDRALSAMGSVGVAF